MAARSERSNYDLLPSPLNPKQLKAKLATATMELGPQHHYQDGLLGLDSIMVVDMDPLSKNSAIKRDNAVVL